MTNHYELTKLFKRKKIIPKCIYPDCNLVRIENEWIKSKREYENYSGTLCHEHLREALRYNRIERELLKGRNL